MRLIRHNRMRAGATKLAAGEFNLNPAAASVKKPKRWKPKNKQAASSIFSQKSSRRDALKSAKEKHEVPRRLTEPPPDVCTAVRDEPLRPLRRHLPPLSPGGGFAIALWKPFAPAYKLVSYPALAGRGGSVSRRDHNQVHRRPRPPCMGNQVQKNAQAYPQLLFGRGGWGEEGFSQRSRLSLSVPYSQLLFGEGGLGRGASLRSGLSHFPYRLLLRERGAGGETGFSIEKRASLLHCSPLPCIAYCRQAEGIIIKREEQTIQPMG